MAFKRVIIRRVGPLSWLLDANAKAAKDWATSDLIRDKLAELGFKIKDTRNGAEWSLDS